ncbi:hypothetical protein Dsin_016470 [Dipteronia sinensis]|uniref:Uncharacterized protein n=1 Tax=Dipteronia sinensis TaxID=43782 RepID=A0AAE0ADA2_9ROSI|nr:hypothetical protein Dsin_016470 [Dipteronia sinensis]
MAKVPSRAEYQALPWLEFLGGTPDIPYPASGKGCPGALAGCVPARVWVYPARFYGLNSGFTSLASSAAVLKRQQFLTMSLGGCNTDQTAQRRMQQVNSISGTALEVDFESILRAITPILDPNRHKGPGWLHNIITNPLLILATHIPFLSIAAALSNRPLDKLNVGPSQLILQSLIPKQGSVEYSDGLPNIIAFKTTSWHNKVSSPFPIFKVSLRKD